MIAVFKNKIRCTFLSLCILTCSSFTVLAGNPGKIEGSVSDAETFKPIPFANVELLKFPDSTMVKITTTTEDGKYHFEDVALGKYILRMSCLGYQKQVIQDFELTPQQPTIKFGTTNLLTASKSLKEVTVVGYKLTGVMQDDKTIYTLNSKSGDLAQSGLELLRQLPDVTVSYMSNDVKLAGSTNIQFQVNGKKVDQNYLEQLNPKLVDKIEVITNPGAKYDSDVDAIINIILKKNISYGLSGRIRAEIPTGRVIINRNNVSIDYFHKKIRIFATGFFRLQRYDMHQITNRTNTPESGTASELNQTTTGTTINKRAGFSYGFDYFADDNNTINFFSSVQPRIQNQNRFDNDITYDSDPISYHNYGKSINTDINKFNDYSLFYKHKFAKKNHDISFEGYYSKRNSQNLGNYYEQNYITDNDLSDDLINQRKQDKTTNNRQFTLKADYNYPITEKLKLSVGYNGNFNRNDYTYADEITDFSDVTKYNENRQNGYTNLALTSGNLNLQGGIRYEYSDINITHVYDTTSNYVSLLPSFSAQYKLGKKQTFRLNYRKAVSRPSVDQLSPTNYKDDSYSQSIGNPDLKPSYNNRIEFTHRIQLIGPMYVSYRPYINFISKGIRQVTLPATDSILRRKYYNVSNDFEYGITLSGTLAFVKWWEISPSYTYFKRKMQALPEYGIASSQSATSWRLSISSHIMLPKEWVGFIEYEYSAPYRDLQSKSQQNYEFVAGIYKPISKKFNVTAFILNPWENKYIYNKSETSANGITQRNIGWVKYAYVIFIRLGYNFNIGKEGKKLDRPTENEENTDNKKGIF
jgi:outer membrane receptor protein involved in Fe transport